MIEWFALWLGAQGATVTCTQDDDGSGYAVFEVTPPGQGITYEITVNRPQVEYIDETGGRPY